MQPKRPLFLLQLQMWLAKQLSLLLISCIIFNEVECAFSSAIQLGVKLPPCGNTRTTSLYATRHSGMGGVATYISTKHSQKQGISTKRKAPTFCVLITR